MYKYSTILLSSFLFFLNACRKEMITEPKLNMEIIKKTPNLMKEMRLKIKETSNRLLEMMNQLMGYLLSLHLKRYKQCGNTLMPELSCHKEFD